MLYITQLVYIKPGQEKVFDEFEAVAMPIISKYNGNLLLRIRPTANTILDAGIDVPYELHLVEFLSEKDFENFMADADRKKYLHLKEQSIEKVTLIKGSLIG